MLIRVPVIGLSYNTDDGHQKIAQAVQDMWKTNLGVEVTLDNSEWKVYIDKVQSLDYNIARMGWLGDFNDPINFLEMYYSATGGNNDTGWENQEFQNLLNSICYRTRCEKRFDLLNKLKQSSWKKCL